MGGTDARHACCRCSLALAEEKYREGLRALGQANGLAKGISAGEYFEEAEMKYAQGVNENHLFSLFAGQLLRMYLDDAAMRRYCSDSRKLHDCDFDKDANVLAVVSRHGMKEEPCDCATCRRHSIRGGRKIVLEPNTTRREEQKAKDHPGQHPGDMGLVPGKTQELFEAWELTDNSLLALGSEISSQIFLSALTNFTTKGTYHAGKAYKDQARRLSVMPLTMLRKLGPADGAANVLDFTIQNTKGLPAFQLCVPFKGNPEYAELGAIKGAIDCSRPM